MKLTIAFSIFVLFFSKANCQTVFTLQLKDSLTQDVIHNALIKINDSVIGTTNNYGYFSSKIICKNSIIKLIIEHSSYKDIFVNLKCGVLNKVIILMDAKLYNVGNAKVNKKTFTKNFGRIEMPLNYIKSIPYLLGELDALKAIQTLPGVTSGFEANSGVHIRGGNTDQTAIYLDDAPVYNIGHFYGFFSPFDGDALKSFSFYNSGINSGFGGRGSSIIDVRFREGNMNNHTGAFTLGFLTSKLLLEGPIFRNKLSYLGSVRFAYPSTFLSNQRVKESIFKNNFIDGNIKIKWAFNSNNTFYLSSFISEDAFSMSDVNGFTIGNSSINKYKWGNKTATLRWNKINKSASFLNTIISISKFSSRAYFDADYEPDFGNELLNYSYKSELDNLKDKFKNLKLGLCANYYQTNQGILYFHRYDTIKFEKNLLPRTKAIETAIFGEYKTNISKLNIDFTSNLRIGYYKNINDNYSDIIFEPRFKLFKKFKKLNIYLAYDKNSQYQSYVGNRQIAIPSDYWIQSSNQFKAQKIHAITIGFSKEFKRFRLTNENYFKNYINALDIKDGGVIFRNPNIAADIIKVKSLAYGSEFLLEKYKGRIQGHLSYTLSRSIRRTLEINNNEWFASNFDRTHVFNAAINYKPNKKWVFGFLGIFQSGTPITANYAYNFLYSLRNEYRLPYYYRLDATISKFFRFAKKIKGEWNISVFNVLFTKNRTSQYPIFDTFSSIPTLPSFSVKINW